MSLGEKGILHRTCYWDLFLNAENFILSFNAQTLAKHLIRQHIAKPTPEGIPTQV